MHPYTNENIIFFVYLETVKNANTYFENKQWEFMDLPCFKSFELIQHNIDLHFLYLSDLQYHVQLN